MLKWTRRILLFLLLGAIVNVAVAWGCVVAQGNVTCDSVDVYWREGDRRRVTIREYSRFGYRVVSDNDIDEPMYTLIFREQPIPYEGWMWWPDERTWDGGHIGVGWPAPALCATVNHEWGPIDEPGGRRVHTLLRYGYTPDQKALPDYLLHDTIPMIFPYRLVWAGFIGNSLLYAVIVAVAAFGASALKRAVRIRRGLCPACAYPRGSSPVCTECGESLPC